jgi:hypothetical protein
MTTGRLITVAMGRVSFDSADIPVAGAPREVLNERITILDRSSPSAPPPSAIRTA